MLHRDLLSIPCDSVTDFFKKVQRRLLWKKIRTGSRLFLSILLVTWIVSHPEVVSKLANSHVSVSNASVEVVYYEKPQSMYEALGKSVTKELVASYVKRTNPKMYDRLAYEIADAVLLRSQQFNLYPGLVIAVMAVESEMDPKSKSDKLALGLMQIRPKTNDGKDVWFDTLRKEQILGKPDDLFDPQVNIHAGCFILRSLIDETRTIGDTLNRYVGSPNTDYRTRVLHNVGKFLEFQIEVGMGLKSLD